MIPDTGNATTVPTKLPENAREAMRVRSVGGAQTAHTACIQG